MRDRVADGCEDRTAVGRSGEIARGLADERDAILATLAAERSSLQRIQAAHEDLGRRAPSASVSRRRTSLRSQETEIRGRIAQEEDDLRGIIHRLQRMDGLLAARGDGSAGPVGLQRPAAKGEADGCDIVRELLRNVSGGYGGRVGPYRIERFLGKGSQATVFLAADAIRRVALKVIDSNSVDISTWGALRKEARRLASIRHGNVVLVHGFDEVSIDAGHDGGIHRLAYTSLEYMQGGTLIDLEQSEAGVGRLLSPSRAVEACLAAARGVMAIHAAGFVHCDIKPHNILTDGGQSFRISDLGVAADIGWDHTKAAGTLAFVSPEIIAAHHERSGRYPVTTACDIYSLGATLYRLLTGCSPVEALRCDRGGGGSDLTPQSVWEAFNANGSLPEPHAIRPEIPSSVSEVVMAATAFDPGSRYASAADLAEALQGVIEELNPVGCGPSRRRGWFW
ncbi:MAG: serine/threonine protein kinase [Planctomycetes bacterium]|nr:serine/threonine protein kinase [Planctomycetota bacterium]